MLNQDATSPALKSALRQAQKIRDFSTNTLKLPDNESYRRYAQLDRPAVVWNVMASSRVELALKPWCFPLLGCVSYKGFYKEASAQGLAAQLRDEGLDVAVMGVAAYSTLGVTSDPLLSTFVGYPPAELARLMFHELAHQVLYVKDDSTFNESFATAVEELGVQLWLEQAENTSFRERDEQLESRRAVFRRLIAQAREDLAGIYANPGLSLQDKLTAKATRFAQLFDEYKQLEKMDGQGWSGYASYFETDLNNAKLAATGLYNQWVPAFKFLFSQCNSQFAPFYASAKKLAGLEARQRNEVLHRLDAQAMQQGCELESENTSANEWSVRGQGLAILKDKK